MAGSDAEVLSRSFRSRILLLVLVLAAGLAAAIWTGTRETGRGAPEDRRRIMVVTVDDGIDYFKVLERAGFIIEVDDRDDWEAEARASLPDSEAEGVGLILELADERGFGLVVFEAPGTLAFDGLELDPEIAEIEGFAGRDYAVLTVGDHAFPHRLTVDEPGEDPLVRLPGYGALEAVFRQELVSHRDDPERPTVEELQYEDAIELGREMVARPAKFEVAIAAARASIDAALDDGSGALALLPTLETGSPIPTPDGGILLVHHELVIASDDARTLELEAAEHMLLSWIGPDAVVAGLASGNFTHEPCTALAGGALAMGERPRIEAAVDGSAVAIGSAEGRATLWRKAGPGCTWAAIAELEGLDSVLLAPQLGGGDRMLAARVESSEERSRILAWALPDGGAGPVGMGPGATTVIEERGRRYLALAFVDDRTLALVSDVAAHDGPGPDYEFRVVLLDRTRPGVYLSVPVEFFASGRKLREIVALAPASEAAGPELLLSAVEPEGRIELIRLTVAASAWTAFVDEPPPVDTDALRMVSLTPEELDAELVTRVDSLFGLSRGAGSLVAYALRDDALPGELAVLDLETGATRRLTSNAVRDYLPRLSADGRFATFVSLMRVNLSVTPFSVPRVIALDGR